MFVSSLREFPENCVYKHGRLLKLFCSIFTLEIIITANFLSYDIESAKKKIHLLVLQIKTIYFMFYYYIFVCI